MLKGSLSSRTILGWMLPGWQVAYSFNPTKRHVAAKVKKCDYVRLSSLLLHCLPPLIHAVRSWTTTLRVPRWNALRSNARREDRHARVAGLRAAAGSAGRPRPGFVPRLRAVDPPASDRAHVLGAGTRVGECQARGWIKDVLVGCEER